MGKAPASQFFWGDWLRDTELQSSCSITRGIWINALSRMWFSKPRGELTMSFEKFPYFLNCTRKEFIIFLQEAIKLKFCDILNNESVTFPLRVTQSLEKITGDITLRNRRMFREEKAREFARLRQERFREKRKSNGEINGEITPPPSSPSPSPKLSLRKESSKTASLESDIESQIEDLKKEISRLVKRDIFNAYEFDKKNKKKHPEARLQVLIRAKQEIEKGNKEFLENPWKLLTHIMTVEHQNANERGGMRGHDAKKLELKKVVEQLK